MRGICDGVDLNTLIKWYIYGSSWASSKQGKSHDQTSRAEAWTKVDRNLAIGSTTSSWEAWHRYSPTSLPGIGLDSRSTSTGNLEATSAEYIWVQCDSRKASAASKRGAQLKRIWEKVSF